MRYAPVAVIIASAAAGTVLAADSLVIAAKAFLAPRLIAAAADGAEDPVRPWPWADWQIVARLSLADSETLYVLDSPSARTLAFGPVLERRGAATIIHGHRDTHLAALDQLQPGQIISVSMLGGPEQDYRVTRRWVAEADALYLPGGGDQPGVMLVTCYPLVPLAGASADQRLALWAEPVLQERPPLPIMPD